MALLLVFMVWEFASDIRGSSEDKQEQLQENKEQESVVTAMEHSEILPVYTQSEVAIETNLQESEQQIVQSEVQIEEIIQEQPQEISAVEALREGISLVMPDEDETGEMGVRYDRSFTAKLIQSSDEVKEWYCEIKNYLLTYRKVHSRISWGRESFRIGRDCFARLAIKGKTLCIYLAIIPKSCQDTKYKIEEVDLPSQKDTPCLYRIKSNRRVTYAKELIDIILQEYDAKLIKNRQAVDYYLPYEGTVDLIKKGLIKRNIVAKRKDFLTKVNSLKNNSDDSVA